MRDQRFIDDDVARCRGRDDQPACSQCLRQMQLAADLRAELRTQIKRTFLFMTPHVDPATGGCLFQVRP